MPGGRLLFSGVELSMRSFFVIYGTRGREK